MRYKGMSSLHLFSGGSARDPVMRWGDRVSRSPAPDEARASDTKILLESRGETIIKVKVLQMFSIFVRRHADACLKGMLMHAAKRAIIVYWSYEKTRLTELARISPDSQDRSRASSSVYRTRCRSCGIVSTIRASSSAIRSRARHRLSAPMSLMAIWMTSRTAPRLRQYSGRWQVGAGHFANG